MGLWPIRQWVQLLCQKKGKRPFLRRNHNFGANAGFLALPPTTSAACRNHFLGAGGRFGDPMSTFVWDDSKRNCSVVVLGIPGCCGTYA